MKAINFKLATFSFAAMLLASCSDSNTTDNSVIGKATTVVPTAVKEADAQSLASRVLNYKGAYESTEVANARVRNAAARGISRAIGVPSNATKLTDKLKELEAAAAAGTDGKWNKHPGTYYIDTDEKVNGNGLNIEGMTIYVLGRFEYDSAYGSNATINIQPSGTLVARNDKEVFGDTYIENNGTIIFPENQSTYTIKNEFDNYAGDLDLGNADLDFQGSNTTRMYVLGNLKANNISINGSQMVVTGSVTTKKFYMTTNGSYCSIGESLTTTNKGEDVYNDYSLKLDNSAKLEVGCSINCSGVVYITNSASIQTLYLTATNYKQDSQAKLILKDQSMVNIAGNFKNMNNGLGTADLADNNGVAVIKADKIYYNAPGKEGDWSQGGTKTVKCNLFTTSGSGAHIIIEAPNGVYGSEWATDKITNDNTTIVWNTDGNVLWYKDEDAKNYSIKKTACNPAGYNDPENSSTGGEDTKPKPSLDLISSIDYDNHEHEISATGIQPLNGHMYMSYHTRDSKHGGCIEVFTPVTNNKVALEQYLYDEGKDLDFNHILATKINSGERMVYLPGSSNKKGAMLAYIPIQQGGKLADKSEAITTVENGQEKVTYKEPLNFVQLNPATKEYYQAGYDENCVVYNDEKNHLIVMTTKGYVVYDANTMNEVDIINKPGKAKHVAIGNGKIVTLHLDKEATSADEAIPATVEVFDQREEDLHNPETTFSVSTIQPNNGKNVVAVKDNKIYVCRGAAGLYCYDIRGNEEWHYQMPSPTITQGDKAGTYKAYANGCYVGNKYVYIAYGSYGLVVLDKNTHEVVAHRQLTKSANYVVEYNGYIYVAYGKERLQVFQLLNADPEVSYNE